MNGFVLTINGKKEVTKQLDNPIVIKNSDYICAFSKMNKFEDDKIFLEEEGILYLLDGVIFNKADLMNKYQSESWDQTYIQMVKEDSNNFMNELRGAFCGFIYDTNTGILQAFTNHSGERAIYYYAQNGVIIVANHMKLIYEALSLNGQEVLPSQQGSLEMLTTGSLLHGNTIIDKVYRITAGNKMIYQEGAARLERYHIFRNIPEHDLSLEECIEEADRLFRQAVDRIFAKNREYGYQAEADLSGGLDSRLVTWVAHDLGYKDVLNVCYCQKGRIDHLSSKKMANYLGNKYFFYPMNQGEFLFDVDELTNRTGGSIVYCLCTGANRVFDLIDSDNIGIAATGLLGEIHNAYLIEGNTHTQSQYRKSKYSNTIFLDVPEVYSRGYDNYEQMNIYEYGMPFILSSVMARQDRCEVYSPFVDKDFMEFSFRIPLKWRKNYYFTINWILSKYPEAAKFVWQTKEKPIDKVYYNQIYWPKVGWDIQDFIFRIYNKVCRTLKINSQIALKGDMNPMQLWYHSNPQLRKFLAEYYERNKSLITDQKLGSDLEKMMNSGICRDKVLVVNLLSIYKLYFNK